jgi:hypothetical protein
MGMDWYRWVCLGWIGIDGCTAQMDMQCRPSYVTVAHIIACKHGSSRAKRLVFSVPVRVCARACVREWVGAWVGGWVGE